LFQHPSYIPIKIAPQNIVYVHYVYIKVFPPCHERPGSTVVQTVQNERCNKRMADSFTCRCG